MMLFVVEGLVNGCWLVSWYQCFCRMNGKISGRRPEDDGWMMDGKNKAGLLESLSCHLKIVFF